VPAAYRKAIDEKKAEAKAEKKSAKAKKAKKPVKKAELEVAN
jgi:hypothetical protein